MRIVKGLMAFGFLVAGLRCSTGQPMGVIRGTVTLDSTVPFGGSRVLYYRVTELVRDSNGRRQPISPPISGAVETGHDGVFLISGLPAGDYYLCALGTRPEHIRSCSWSARPVHVRLTSAAPTQSVELMIRSGTIVRLMVRDPNGRLARGASFRASTLSDRGHVEPFELDQRDSSGPLFRMAMPRDSSTRLIVLTNTNVFDAAGNRHPTHAPGLRISPEGRPEVAIVLNIQ